MGTNYYAIKKKPSVDRMLHIGKSSWGHKFLFHEVDDFDLKIYTFPQWKAWLEEHIGNDYILLDEYDELVTLTDFFDMVEKEQERDNEEDFEFPFKNIDNYRFYGGDFS